MNATPWYKSPVFVTLLVSFISGLTMLFPKAALLLHLGTREEIQATVEFIVGWVGSTVTLVTVIVSAIGMIKRKGSPIQPLTLTQKAADAHPQTIANSIVSNPPTFTGKP